MPGDSGESTPTALDQEIIEYALGATSDIYQERGYQGEQLGRSFDSMTATTELWTYPETHWRYRFFSKPDLTGPEYVFAKDSTLIYYAKGYKGDPREYIEQLVSLFGKSNRTPVTVRGSRGFSLTSVNYTFPQVLVRLSFNPNNAGVEVLDRKWAQEVLARDAKTKRACVTWIRKALGNVAAGDWSLANAPPLVGATAQKEEGEYGSIKYIGVAPAGDQQRLPWAIYGSRPDLALGEEPSDTPSKGLRFTFWALPRPEELGRLAKDRLPDDPVTGTDWYPDGLYEIPFMAALARAITLGAMQQEFPPDDNEIELRYSGGEAAFNYYEWFSTSKDGSRWRVWCSDLRTDEVIVSLSPRKRL